MDAIAEKHGKAVNSQSMVPRWQEVDRRRACSRHVDRRRACSRHCFERSTGRCLVPVSRVGGRPEQALFPTCGLEIDRNRRCSRHAGRNSRCSRHVDRRRVCSRHADRNRRCSRHTGWRLTGTGVVPVMLTGIAAVPVMWTGEGRIPDAEQEADRRRACSRRGIGPSKGAGTLRFRPLLNALLKQRNG